MEELFHAIHESQKLKLPNGKVLEDTAIIPRFCQDVLKIDPSEIWNKLQELSNHDDSEFLECGEGWDVKWLKGSHRSLKYRGNAIKREKIWLQTDYEKGMKRYGYTGWQWLVSAATKRIESISFIKDLVDKINTRLDLKKPHNHWIITRYAKDDHNIGFHSDKVKDWEEDSCFIVIKLGETRKFEFSWDEEEVKKAKQELSNLDRIENKEERKLERKRLTETIKKRKYREVFFSEYLEEGTAIIVGMKSNQIVKHGVPSVKEGEKSGVSGSIVGRCIKTSIDWDTVRKEINKRRNS